MVMATEAEARVRLCPFLPWNEDVNGRSCRASACMMWRWELGRVVTQGRKLGAEEPWKDWNWDPRRSAADKSVYMENFEFRDAPAQERQGWCGLAGQP